MENFAGETEANTEKNWYNHEENLFNAALHKIIVEKKFQPPTNENQLLVTEWSLLKSKNYTNVFFFCYGKYKVNNVSIQDKPQYHLH